MNLFRENTNFYPTPKEVINTMMLGENIAGKTILEPSAGSGNIVSWLYENGANEILACENDKQLQKLLAGKCNLIAEDFLKVTSDMISHIDYIVMNPPFNNGVEHIMHAFEIAPAGCTIIALCNSSNINNRYIEERKVFNETIELYGTYEHLGSVFEKSERNTDVNVSLVKLYKSGEKENEWTGYMFSDEEDALDRNETEGLVQYNVIRDMVNRYISAVKLFDETMAASEKINSIAKFSDSEYSYPPVRFATVNANGNVVEMTHDRYKKQLQKYYWRIIFDKLNMEKYATNGLREQINRFVEQQVNVPFTMHNIYKVLDMVIQTTGQRMNTALLEAFDLICSFSAENSTAGEKWKTNANYMVNKKFIVPYMTDYDARWPKAFVSISYSSQQNKIEDVVKALCYITGTNYDNVKNLRDAIYYTDIPWGKWFDWAFFRVKAFKKGTMHFVFKDENVWLKFNQEVAKQRGWILPKKSA